jgi:hypothetical protein
MTILLNPKVWIALALAAVLAFAGAFLYRAGRAAVQSEFTQWKLTAQENRLLADRAQRTEEQRRQAVADQEAQNANSKLVRARADAVIANAAAGKLRGQLAAYIAAVRRASQGAAAAAGGASQPSADPLDLLAQLYGRTDDAAGAIGQYADQLAISGAACERIADGLQPPSR